MCTRSQAHTYTYPAFGIELQKGIESRCLYIIKTLLKKVNKIMKCKNLKVYLPSIMQNRKSNKDAYRKEEKGSRKEGKKWNRRHQEMSVLENERLHNSNQSNCSLGSNTQKLAKESTFAYTQITLYGLSRL